MRRTITLVMGMMLWLGQISASQAASQSVNGIYLGSYSDAITCNSASLCVLSFLPLPAGPTYLIQRVRCRVNTSTLPRFMIFGPASQAGDPSLFKRTYFEQISGNFLTPFYYFTFEAIPQMTMAAGRYPTVTVQTDTTSAVITMECSLSGITI